jgi:hypothetical protein
LEPSFSSQPAIVQSHPICYRYFFTWVSRGEVIDFVSHRRKTTINFSAFFRGHLNRSAMIPYALVQPTEVDTIIHMTVSVSVFRRGRVFNDVRLWVIPIQI